MGKPDPFGDEDPTDKLAAMLRDGLLGLVIVAVSLWFVWLGIRGVFTGHLDTGIQISDAESWFTKPLNGLPAVLAGISFWCLASAAFSIMSSHARIASRVPRWMPRVWGWFVAAWAVLYFSARLLSGA